MVMKQKTKIKSYLVHGYLMLISGLLFFIIYDNTSLAQQSYSILQPELGNSVSCPILIEIKKFPSPSESIHGLAWDGSNLWCVQYGESTISKLDDNGNILSTIPSPGPSSTGIVYVNGSFYIADDHSLQIYQIDKEGHKIKEINAPGIDSTGLAFDGSYLWNADFNWNNDVSYLHKINIHNLTDIITIPAPGTGPEGLTYDGSHIWHVDFYSNKLYKLDFNGEVICRYQPPGYNPIGLTFDGRNLYLGENGEKYIHKLFIQKQPLFIDEIWPDVAYDMARHIRDKNQFSDFVNIFHLHTTQSSIDCNGVTGGKAYIDRCGECVGGSTGKTPCTQDCNGVWGGSAVVDECGICGGDGVTCHKSCTLTCKAEGFNYSCGSHEYHSDTHICYLDTSSHRGYVNYVKFTYSNGHEVICKSSYCGGPLICSDDTGQSCSSSPVPFYN